MVNVKYIHICIMFLTTNKVSKRLKHLYLSWVQQYHFKHIVFLFSTSRSKLALGQPNSRLKNSLLFSNDTP